MFMARGLKQIVLNVKLFWDNSLKDFRNQKKICDGSIVGEDLFV